MTILFVQILRFCTVKYFNNNKPTHFTPIPRKKKKKQLKRGCKNRDELQVHESDDSD